MTETEWLQSCEPRHVMLPFLRQQGVPRRKAGRRKLRAFALACCRHLADLPTTKLTQEALALLGRLVEGLASTTEQRQAREALSSKWCSCPPGELTSEEQSR